ncbi:hypothetical protein PMAYCL1PPCAC_10412 [Pristionchus mayeri]|uniref:Uncharacterized protein n=1 Tax=Pristionchus mayeri TaxID=1317129 RepID=A0AAN5CE32_9BILA|nr:hypothetical protein PMAYCL1PPCAC_10412 [Pristionchus mayeri]
MNIMGRNGEEPKADQKKDEKVKRKPKGWRAVIKSWFVYAARSIGRFLCRPHIIAGIVAIAAIISTTVGICARARAESAAAMQK